MAQFWNNHRNYKKTSATADTDNTGGQNDGPGTAEHLGENGDGDGSAGEGDVSEVGVSDVE